MKDLATDLDRRRAEHLYRRRRVVETPQGPVLRVEGRELIAFCSNDYLGLASDPRVVEALQRAAARWGAGSGAAHLVTGHSAAHHALEEELAAFTGRPRALLFSTGYMANLGVLSALLGRGDTVFEDRLNHASLLDGGLLSRARLRRYPHADPAALAVQLADAKGERLVATDGVFSMDGDLAPLPELAETCRRHGAWLMVDADAVPVLMGTLGKAFGTFGAFVAGAHDLIETLIQAARPYIYTTAPPPAVAEATRAALRIAQAEEWRREHLRVLVRRFRAGAAALGLPLADSPTPIQPILLGDAARAVRWSAALEARGLLVTAIRPPTVPPGSARLRITFSAAHTEAQVDRLLDALAALGRAEAA
jgi:8-amino-7-oxononanoate synthase